MKNKTTASSPLNSLPFGFKDTPLGPLPQEWDIVRLRTVTEETKTRDPRQISKETFLYVDIGGVSNRVFEITKRREILGGDAPSRARKVIRAKDTIFATVRPYLKNIAQVPAELDNQICSTGYCVLRANTDMVDADFLFFTALNESFVRNVVAHQRGTNYPAVSDEVVFEQLIPLPSLSEQRIIAHVLTAVRRAIETTGAVITATTELKRSLMQHLFTYGPVMIDKTGEVPLKTTEMGEVPECWDLVHLKDVATISKKPRGLQLSKFNQIPFFSMEVLPTEGIFAENYHLITPDHITSGTFVNKGDILLPKITPSFENGKQGIVEHISMPFAYATTEVYPLHPANPERLDQIFLFHYLKTPRVRAEIAGKMEGTTGRKRIPKHIVQMQLLPLPPIKDQRTMARQISTLEIKIQAEMQRRTALEVLFQSLLYQLMMGKVRVGYVVEGWPVAVPAQDQAMAISEQPAHYDASSHQLQEAALIATLVHEQYQLGKIPVTRFRYQKLGYFYDRFANREDALSHYEKQPYGPYDWSKRYGGVEEALIQRGYLVGMDDTHFAPGANIEEALQIAKHSHNIALVRHVIEELGSFTDNKLELWSTVDYSARELTQRKQFVSRDSILALWQQEPTWASKVDKFSPEEVARALQGLKIVFGKGKS